MTRVILLLLALLSVEVGVQLWHHRETPSSGGPVFFLTNVNLVSEAPPPLGTALEIYRANRGTDETAELPDGTRLQIMYFEWDTLEAGPFANLSGHESASCNVAAGFAMAEDHPPRKFETPGQPALDFNASRLIDPNGKDVFTYKMPWFQGQGTWLVHSDRNRWLRFQRSLTRHRGAARVLQFAVFGAANEDAAWEVIRQRLDRDIEWR